MPASAACVRIVQRSGVKDARRAASPLPRHQLVMAGRFSTAGPAARTECLPKRLSRLKSTAANGSHNRADGAANETPMAIRTRSCKSRGIRRRGARIRTAKMLRTRSILSEDWRRARFGGGLFVCLRPFTEFFGLSPSVGTRHGTRREISHSSSRRLARKNPRRVATLRTSGGHRCVSIGDRRPNLEVF